MKKIISLILVFAILMSTAVFADKINKSDKELRKEIDLLITQYEIKAHEYAVNKATSNLEYNELYWEKLEKLLKKINVEIVSKGEEPLFTAYGSSVPSDAVTISTPTTYLSSQGYVIKANARWNQFIATNYSSHLPLLSGNVGGGDGLGMYFSNSNNIRIIDSSFYSYDENYGSYNQNIYPFDINSDGVFYMPQDKISNSLSGYYKYTCDELYMSVWVEFDGPVNTTVRTKYTHTWNNTGISSVSISGTGIGITYGSSSDYWQGVSTGYATITY
jgi:hypothetical protein